MTRALQPPNYQQPHDLQPNDLPQILEGDNPPEAEAYAEEQVVVPPRRFEFYFFEEGFRASYSFPRKNGAGGGEWFFGVLLFLVGLAKVVAFFKNKKTISSSVEPLFKIESNENKSIESIEIDSD